MRTTINYDMIQEFKGTNGGIKDEVFECLVQLYLESSLLNLEKIELFYCLDDMSSLKKEAHAWAASSGIIGAEKLANILMEIELAEYPFPEVEDLLEDCWQEFLRVESSLQEIINGRGSVGSTLDQSSKNIILDQ